MECPRTILRHVVGVEATKERKRLRHAVQMKKIEEYFCENKVYIPSIQIGKRKFIHRNSKTDDTNNTKYSDDDMVFRVPADDRNMSSTYTSMFYPNTTAKIEHHEGPESMHQDIKETFIEGIVTHTADRDQLMTSWDMSTNLFQYIDTPEERAANAAAVRRSLLMHLDEQVAAEKDLIKPFTEQDITSASFVKQVVHLLLRGYSPSFIYDAYAVSFGADRELKSIPVAMDGEDVIVDREYIGTIAGPADVRNANTVVKRIEEIQKALKTHDLKVKTNIVARTDKIVDQWLIQQFAQHEALKSSITGNPLVGGVIPYLKNLQKTVSTVSSAVQENVTGKELSKAVYQSVIDGFEAMANSIADADFIRSQFVLAQLPKSIDSVNAVAYDILTRDYLCYVIATKYVLMTEIFSAMSKDGRSIDREFYDAFLKAVATLSSDPKAQEKVMEVSKIITPRLKVVDGNVDWDSLDHLVDVTVDRRGKIEKLHAMLFEQTDEEIQHHFRMIMELSKGAVDIDKLNLAENPLFDLSSPEFYAKYIGSGGIHSFNDYLVMRNQTLVQETGQQITASIGNTMPLSMLELSRAYVINSADTETKSFQQALESIVDEAMPSNPFKLSDSEFEDVKIDKTGDKEDEVDESDFSYDDESDQETKTQIKPFKLTDYFSDLEEFKENHPAPRFLNETHASFLYGGKPLIEDGVPEFDASQIEYEPGNGQYDSHNYFYEVEFLKPIGEYQANRKLYIEKVAHQKISNAQDDINSLIDQLESMHIEASRLGKTDAINAAASKFSSRS